MSNLLIGVYRRSSAALLVLMAGAISHAQPVCTSWIKAVTPTVPNSTIDRIRPDVHDVSCGDPYVEVRSAGISLYQFGILANPVNPGIGIRDIAIRIPRHPQPEIGAHATLPAETIGVFVNGVPIENHLGYDSFEGRNLWHYDLNSPFGVDPSHTGITPLLTQLLKDGSRPSPIIGFALDGYPIYGPWANPNGVLKRMRSSYRLRAITERTTWPDGTHLTPGQFGPPIDKTNPLGIFSEDYEYVDGSGDLDRFNGRFVVTPEYPEGTYAYFLATDDDGQLAFPYLLANAFYGKMPSETITPARIAQPKGFTLSATSARPQAGTPVTFSFETAEHALEFVHEKPIHLIVVSEDLSEFSHIHPARTWGDSYRVVHTFPHGGHYRLYAEFTLPGEGPRIEAFDLQVMGTPKPAQPLSTTTRTQPALSGLVAELTASATLHAGVDELLRFRLNSTAGLQPWLGAWGHFVLIGDGMSSFIHAHPIDAATPAQSESGVPHRHPTIQGNTPPPDVLEVPVAFPRAGLYKLWAQFQVNGEVQVIPFVLRVAPGATPATTTAIPKSAIRVSVGPAGFTPARIEIPAGKATTLAVTRDSQPNCASKIVFPDLGITRDLPPGKTVLVSLPATSAKELKFACGMGMYRGLLVVK